MAKTMDNGIVLFDNAELNIAPILEKEKKIEIFLEELSCFLRERKAAIGIEKTIEKDGTCVEEFNVVVDGYQIATKLQKNITSIWFTDRVLDRIKDLIKINGIHNEREEKEKND